MDLRIGASLLWRIEKCRAKPGEPKQLQRLLDVLHLLTRSAPKTLIHRDIQSARRPPATKLATSYPAPAPQRAVLHPRIFAAF
jgi:hypothetical protein